MRQNQRKLKKKSTIALTIIAAILISVIGVVLFWAYLSDYSRVLKINWGFSLPQESRYSNTYSQNSGASFNGDGIRYHVFSCENVDSINKMFVWQLTEQETIYHGSYSAATDEWLSKLNVPLNERPDYGNCSYWYRSQNDNSEIIVLWNKDQGMLYVIESFL